MSLRTTRKSKAMRIMETEALKIHRKSIPLDLVHDPTLKSSLKKFNEPLATNIDRAREMSPRPKIAKYLSPAKSRDIKQGNVVFSNRRSTIPFSPSHNANKMMNDDARETMNTTFMTTTSIDNDERTHEKR